VPIGRYDASLIPASLLPTKTTIMELFLGIKMVMVMVVMSQVQLLP